MSLQPRSLVPLSIGVHAVSIALAPSAVADPPNIPEPGSAGAQGK